MSESLVLLAIILIVMFSEWREFKLRAEMKALNKVIDDYAKTIQASQSELYAIQYDISAILEKQNAVSTSIKNTEEFMSKISVDLGTIVQEYEINGIWLGKDRNKSVDAYEG